jgi:hypothetical protein
MPTPHERLEALFTARPITLELPIGIERRIKAHLHRMNGEIVSAGEEAEVELFDTAEDLDIGFALLALAERALDLYEDEACVRYDTCTGKPLATLDDLPRER